MDIFSKKKLRGFMFYDFSVCILQSMFYYAYSFLVSSGEMTKKENRTFKNLCNLFSFNISRLKF